MLSLPIYTVQAHLIRDGGTHSGLGFSSLIINQEISRQIFPQANQIQAVLQLRSQVCQDGNKANWDSCFIYWESFISLNITCLFLLPPFSLASSIILSPVFLISCLIFSKHCHSQKHVFPLLCFLFPNLLWVLWGRSWLLSFPVMSFVNMRAPETKLSKNI